MTCEVAVWDGDGCGPLNGINKTILAIGHRKMIKPKVWGSKYRNPISITLCPKPSMVHGVPDHAATGGNNVMYVKPMNYHVLHEMYGNASPIGNVNVGATGVDGLVWGYQQLLGQLDDHAASECNPQGALLDHCMAESPRLWVHEVVVRGISDNVVSPPQASGGLAAETEDAFRQPLAFLGPVFPAPPAPVNWICC